VAEINDVNCIIKRYVILTLGFETVGIR